MEKSDTTGKVVEKFKGFGAANPNKDRLRNLVVDRWADCLTYIVAGRSRTEVIRQLCKKFNLEPSEAANLITMVMTNITQDVKFELTNQFDLAIMRRRDLYEKAYLGGDIRTALMIEQDMTKLLGLYATNSDVDINPLTQIIQALNNAAGIPTSLPGVIIDVEVNDVENEE